MEDRNEQVCKMDGRADRRVVDPGAWRVSGGLFQKRLRRHSLAVGLAAVAPIIVFSIWFAASEPFRRFALSLDTKTLTLAQSWRVLGVTFVVLEAHHLLPAIFALPAGYGDIAVGATAGFAAVKLANPAHRKSYILWQALGMADLIIAVGLGTTARLLSPDGASMLPMTVLPLSLVPTFFVPLLFIFHIISIAQAKGWKSDGSEPTFAIGRAGALGNVQPAGSER